jgi:hypothetical protein
VVRDILAKMEAAVATFPVPVKQAWEAAKQGKS